MRSVSLQIACAQPTTSLQMRWLQWSIWSSWFVIQVFSVCSPPCGRNLRVVVQSTESWHWLCSIHDTYARQGKLAFHHNFIRLLFHHQHYHFIGFNCIRSISCKLDSKTKKARCHEEGNPTSLWCDTRASCLQLGSPCLLAKVKANWEPARLPLKDQDDHLLRILEKVKSQVMTRWGGDVARQMQILKCWRKPLSIWRLKIGRRGFSMTEISPQPLLCSRHYHAPAAGAALGMDYYVADFLLTLPPRIFEFFQTSSAFGDPLDLSDHALLLDIFSLGPPQ